VRRALPAARVTIRAVPDRAWREAWKRHARPVRIGRLTILPTWWKDAGVGRRVTVRIDPGMAFGSGEHPTTQLCLAGLDRQVSPGMTVIDVGTGSGILAIAAAWLGAARVLAIDNDPVAVAVARQNVRANRAGGQVTVRLAGTLGRLRPPADLIVANLTAQTLPPVLAAARRCLRPRGRFVASGFGTAKAGEVSAAMRTAGLRPVAVERRRGWCAIHAVLRSGPG
jgi:ribosomal protein L11 methyltransferase